MKTDIILAMAALVGIAIVTIGLSGEPQPPSPYCDMRQVWQETDGAHGWPEYEPGKDKRMGCGL